MLGGVLFAATMTLTSLSPRRFGDSRAGARSRPRRSDWVPLALVALFTLRGIGDFYPDLLSGSRSAGQVVKAIRPEVFAHSCGCRSATSIATSSATLLSRLTYNTEQIGQATTDSVIVVVRNSLTIIGSLGGLLWLNWRLAIYRTDHRAVVAWLVSDINRHFRRYSRRIQDSMGDVTRVAKESSRRRA